MEEIYETGDATLNTRKMNKEIFKYYNPNPTDRGEEKHWHKGDCVVRAFCCALDKPWGTVYKDLCEIGAKKFDMPNSDKVADAYAKENDMVKISLKDYIPLWVFAREFDGTYVCRIRKHMVCVKDHLIQDVWNCGDYKVKTVYRKEE